ncbi:hypothetical protein BRARA_F01224 [Brassica rapa]|uniref:No apical meristem-associated C-terminal domain-containing protein n=1 Tax=Brassica campestris TaxID=3711 RepID=A0A397YWP2_BRACM|nr:hypothetical protein BRARA_F01224 [Brassica rapa]
MVGARCIGENSRNLFSQVGGNSGSKSSGSKRAHDSDASDSNSVGSTARLMGMDAAKKKAKKKDKSAQEFERLEKLAMMQEEANQRRKEAIQRQKMKMWLKLSEKEYLNDKSKEMFQQLSDELFEN